MSTHSSPSRDRELEAQVLRSQELPYLPQCPSVPRQRHRRLPTAGRATFVGVLLALMGWRLVPVAAVEFMPVDSLRAGMTGVGLTVLRGSKIDSFSVEILGVQRSPGRPGRHRILGRLSGAGLEETGIIQGMSGSPVYVGGRLVGAVAYGWSGDKSSLCGITPIADMLEVLHRDMASPVDGSAGWSPLEAAARRLGAPTPKVELRHETADEILWLDEGVRSENPGPIQMEPLATPVWMSASTPEQEQVIRRLLEPFGLQFVGPVGGGSFTGVMADDEAEPVPVVPGSSLGVRYIEGDLNITGIGTVTHVEGDRVVGFGHPFLLAGGVDMPMTGAHIFEVLSSRQLSFKIGSGTTAIGALRQDRYSGVAGLIGAEAGLLPVVVELTSQDGVTDYTFGLMRHQDLTPVLTQIVVLRALESTQRLGGVATLKVESTIVLGGGRRLEISRVYGGEGAVFAAAQEIARPLSIFSRSEFDGLQAESLHLDIAYGEEMETARILALRLDSPVCHPGDEVTCLVTLQPYRRLPEEHTVRIEVPDDLAPGSIQVRVGSGRASDAWEVERLPDAFRPRSADHLLQLLGRRQRADELVLELFRGGEGLSIDGRELPGLPVSARAALRESHGTGRMGTVHGRVVGRRRLAMSYVLSGEQTVELTVKGR